jgi:hypothetical protein
MNLRKGTDLELRDKDGNLLADPHSLLNGWKISLTRCQMYMVFMNFF